MSPVDYHGWTHAPKSQGGTDPIPGLPTGGGGTLPYAWGRWVGSQAVSANTLFSVAASDDYDESYIDDPDNLAGFTFDRGSGCLSWTQPGEYYVWAAGQWNGTGSNGDTLATVIDLGASCSFSTDRAIGMIVADDVNENMWVPCDRTISDFNAGSVRALVYHTDSGGNDIGAVWIHCVQIKPTLDGEFDP